MASKSCGDHELWNNRLFMLNQLS